MIEVIFGLVGVVLGWLLGLFSEPLKSWWFGPRLKFAFDSANQTDVVRIIAHCDFGPGGTVHPFHAVYARVRVQNIGWSAAEDVEVIARAAWRREAAGYVRERTFPPQNLKWSNVGTEYYPLIPAKVERHLDIFLLAKPDTVRNRRLRNRVVPTEKQQLLSTPDNLIELQTHIPSNAGHDLLPAGDYKIELLTVARNASPEKVEVFLKVSTTWNETHPQEAIEVTGVTSGAAL